MIWFHEKLVFKITRSTFFDCCSNGNEIAYFILCKGFSNGVEMTAIDGDVATAHPGHDYFSQRLARSQTKLRITVTNTEATKGCYEITRGLVELVHTGKISQLV